MDCNSLLFFDNVQPVADDLFWRSSPIIEREILTVEKKITQAKESERLLLSPRC
jgi:hypothetical protein